MKSTCSRDCPDKFCVVYRVFSPKEGSLPPPDTGAGRIVKRYPSRYRALSVSSMPVQPRILLQGNFFSGGPSEPKHFCLPIVLQLPWRRRAIESSESRMLKVAVPHEATETFAVRPHAGMH